MIFSDSALLLHRRKKLPLINQLILLLLKRNQRKLLLLMIRKILLLRKRLQKNQLKKELQRILQAIPLLKRMRLKNLFVKQDKGSKTSKMIHLILLNSLKNCRKLWTSMMNFQLKLNLSLVNSTLPVNRRIRILRLAKRCVSTNR